MNLRSGLDILEIQRIRNLLASSEARFLSRHFTDTEIHYCSSRRDPATHFAGRLAAKEAIFKALRLSWYKGFSWRSIEILSSPDGSPLVRLHGEIQEQFRKAGLNKTEISISHTTEYAAATALVWNSEENCECATSDIQETD